MPARSTSIGSTMTMPGMASSRADVPASSCVHEGEKEKHCRRTAPNFHLVEARRRDRRRRRGSQATQADKPSKFEANYLDKLKVHLPSPSKQSKEFMLIMREGEKWMGGTEDGFPPSRIRPIPGGGQLGATGKPTVYVAIRAPRSS
jgi:hypothetical protein